MSRQEKNQSQQKSFLLSFLLSFFLFGVLLFRGAKRTQNFWSFAVSTVIEVIEELVPEPQHLQQAARPKSNAGALAVPTRNSTIPRTWLNIVSVN